MKKLLFIFTIVLLTFDIQAKEIARIGFEFDVSSKRNMTFLSPCFGDEVRGAYVLSVDPGGPLAEQSGIHVGDVIFALDGKKIFHPFFAFLILDKKNIGEEIKIEYIKKQDISSGKCIQQTTTVLPVTRNIGYDQILSSTEFFLNFIEEADGIDYNNSQQVSEYFYSYVIDSAKISNDIQSMVNTLITQYEMQPWSKKFFAVINWWYGSKYDAEEFFSVTDVDATDPSPLAERWAEENLWFFVNEEMTKFAFQIHAQLLGNNYNPDSFKYYAKIDERMREKYPNYNWDDSKFSQTLEKIGTKKFSKTRADKYYDEKNFVKFFNEMEVGAFEGNIKATAEYANSYCKGQGVQANLEECLFWFEVASYLNHVNSMETLAWIYRFGEVDGLVLPIDDYEEHLIRSQQLCEKAAERRSAYCMLYLGDYKYYQEEITKVQQYANLSNQASPFYEDLSEALFWYMLANKNVRSDKNKEYLKDLDYEQQLKNIHRRLTTLAAKGLPNKLFPEYTAESISATIIGKVEFMVNKWKPGDTYESLLREMERLNLYRTGSLKQNIYFQSGESQTIKGSVQDEIVNIVEQDGDWSLIEHTQGQGCLEVNQEDFKEDEKNCRIEKGWIRSDRLLKINDNDPIIKIVKKSDICVDPKNKTYTVVEEYCPEDYDNVSLGDFIARNYVNYKAEEQEILIAKESEERIVEAVPEMTTNVEESAQEKIIAQLQNQIAELLNENAKLKEIKKKGLQPGGEEEKDTQGFGEYHALLIGINDYKNLQSLDTPVNDVRAIEEILFKKYNFNPPIMLINEEATSSRIWTEFENLISILDENDNLLIYYAGHGYEDKIFGQGFWQLYEAEAKERHTWFSLDAALKPFLSVSKAGHIFVVVDSCFAGQLFKQRSGEDFEEDDREYETILEDHKKLSSRLGLTSSNLREIPDSGYYDRNHSLFAKVFIEILENNSKSYISSAELSFLMKDKINDMREGLSDDMYEIFKHIKLQYNNISGAKHETGGEFYFDLQG